jgi:hypothetical protein
VPFSQNSAPAYNPFTNVRPCGKIIPVSSWNIQFSGDSDSKLSLAEFLRETELKFQESHLTDSDFWRSSHNLFVGVAKTWFLANKHLWTDWHSFQIDLVQNFKPANYDERLWEQLRLRTQAKNERLERS